MDIDIFPYISMYIYICMYVIWIGFYFQRFLCLLYVISLSLYTP